MQRAGVPISSPVSASSSVTAAGSRSAARLVAAHADQPSLHLRQPEGGVVGGDHEVAAQHDAEAAGDGGAVHRGDDRLRVHAVDEDRGTGTVVGGDAIARREGLEVHPRGEGLIAGSGEDDHADGVVVLRAVNASPMPR